jgi:histidinol-phosphate aminotransferase
LIDDVKVTAVAGGRMKKHFKSHLVKIQRYQTSCGRDMEEGLRLDRNEKVSNFSKKVRDDIFSRFKGYSISASPDATQLYHRISKYIGVSKDEIYILGGITEGIRILFETLTNPGENVIVLDPTYPMYYVYSNIFQVEYRRFRYSEDFKPDWSSLFESMDGKTTMVMNPNLPIESAFQIDEIQTILEKCEQYNAILVVDEAYHYFGAPTVMELVRNYNNLVVMRSFSKAYGMAGLRLGFMVSNADNIAYLSKTRSLVESNTITMSIAEYMLDHPELRDQHVREVKEGAVYLQQEMTKIGVPWHGGNVTNGILLFLNNDKEPRKLEHYLKEKKIYIRGSFEEPYNMCIRISIGPKDIMEKFVAAFKEWLLEKDEK